MPGLENHARSIAAVQQYSSTSNTEIKLHVIGPHLKTSAGPPSSPPSLLNTMLLSLTPPWQQQQQQQHQSSQHVHSSVQQQRRRCSCTGAALCSAFLLEQGIKGGMKGIQGGREHYCLTHHLSSNLSSPARPQRQYIAVPAAVYQHIGRAELPRIAPTVKPRRINTTVCFRIEVYTLPSKPASP
jgi:hypothetical protein